MANVPQELQYTDEHEYVKTAGEDGVYASESPTMLRASSATSSSWSCRRRARRSRPGDVFGTIEAVKAVSELYCPVAGEVVEVERRARRQPGPGQHRPLRRGVDDQARVSDPGQLDGLLDAAAYEAEDLA